jgi:hypothetical protein
MLAIGLAMIKGHAQLAWGLEVVLLLFLAALIFGRFCAASYLWHVLTGKRAFANQTLPWSRGK